MMLLWKTVVISQKKKLNPELPHCFIQLLSCVRFFARTLQHTRLLCPPLSPRVCSDSYPRTTIRSSNSIFVYARELKARIRYLHTNVDSSMIHSSSELETTQCQSVNEGQITLACSYNGVLLSFKKEPDSNTCYNMGES